MDRRPDGRYGADRHAGRRHAELARAIRAAFNDEFVTPAGRVGPNTQTAYVVALHFDLLPEHLRPLAAERLAEVIEQSGCHLTTGFVGTPYLCHVLSRFGYTDVAYRLLAQETHPCVALSRHAGRDHHLGALGRHQARRQLSDCQHELVQPLRLRRHRRLALPGGRGIEIDPEVPGCRHVLIQPPPGGQLTYAGAALDSMVGRIESRWSVEAGCFRLAVAVPANAEGVVHLPAASVGDITEDGLALHQVEGVREINRLDKSVVFTVGSGRYRFNVRTV